MDKKKILYIVIFGVIILSCLWAFISASFITKNFKNDVLNSKQEQQEVEIESIAIAETKDGKKYWEVYADEGHWDSSSKVAMMTDVVGNFYQNDEVVLSFISKYGTFNQETRQIELSVDSYIVYKDGTNIKADNFSFKGKDDDVTANGNVRIERNAEVVAYADQAILYNKMNNFKIYGNTKTEIYGTGMKEL